MKQRKIYLQLFNDGAGEGTPEPQAQTQTVEITSEAVEQWLGTDEGKRFLQPKLDSYHTKGLQSWQEKNIDKIKEDARGEVKTSMQQQIDDLNTSLTANKINSEVKLKLLSEGVDKEDVDLLMRAIDISKISVDGEKMIGLNDVVDNLKESRPKWFNTQQAQTKTGTGKTTIPAGAEVPSRVQGKLSRDELNKLDSQDRIKYKQENKDWYKYI